jgi:glycolate oxidase
MALFSTVTDATRAVTNIISRRLTPRCIELLDGPTLQILRDAGNPLNPKAESLLLIDVDGTENEVEEEAMAVLDACEAASALEGLVAQNSAQRDRLWSARREMSYAVRRLSKHKLSEDVVVPRRRLRELIEGVHRLSETYDIKMPAYGHAGDGNMHVNFLWNDPEEKRRVDQATKALFELTIQLGGTLSGEHGIGVLKAPYLPLEQSPQLIDLQRQLKQVFDPKGLLNPGKIFPRLGHGPC